MTERSLRLKIAYVLEPRDETDPDTVQMLQRLDSLCRDNADIALSIFDMTDGAACREIAGISDNPSGRVTYRSSKGETMLSCFNQVLEEGEDPEWIQFLHSSAVYDTDMIRGLLSLAEQSRTDAVAMEPIQDIAGKKQSGLLYPEREFTADMSQQSSRYWNFSLDCYFLRRAAIGQLRFDQQNLLHGQQVFLMSFFDAAKNCYISRVTCRIHRFLMTDPDGYRPAFDREWYETAIRLFLLPAIRENPSSAVLQSGMLYLVLRKLHANRNNWQKEVLSAEEIEAFFGALTQLLQYIDDEWIVAHPEEDKTAYDQVLSLYLLKLKNRGRPCQIAVTEEGDVTADTGRGTCRVDHVSNILFQIDAMNHQNHALVIDGEVRNIPWADYSLVKAYAQCGEERIQANYTGICRFEKLFGHTIWRGYMVQVVIPEDLLQSCDIHFSIEYGEKEYICRKLRFGRIQARLHHKYRNQYWVFGNRMIFRSWENAWSLHAQPYRRVQAMKRELRLLREIKSRDLRLLRILFHLTGPFLRGRPIWITYDQLYKGGDNGEYFFRYVSEHDKKIRMYYLVNEDIRGFDRIRLEGRLLYANTSGWFKKMKTWLFALHADMIFSTRASVDSFFDMHRTKVRAAVCDLFDPEIVCIQHGLTVQKIAQYQNRIQDNMRHYFCASPFEQALLLRPAFGYNASMTSVTGLARYDGLDGIAEKQILICPTWRRSVTDGLNEKGKMYGYNPSFRESEFYRIYQKLISDRILMECVKEHGYRIVFVLHPNIGAQAKDFIHDDLVRVISGVDVDYEELMGASRLMVTDYSGVQFDFAYMRRPLLYYRPKELPPQYEEGVSFSDMEFGPVCCDHSVVIDHLCRMIRNSCRLETEYRKNIDHFFPYHDRRNCQRLHDAARELQRKRTSDG